MHILLYPVFLFSFTFGLGIDRFDTVIIFGDSHTDTGNVYKLTNYTWPISPPYYQGRFTNNRNWVDRLNMIAKSNYAHGGATTDSSFVQGLTKSNTVSVPGIRQQVAFYIKDTLYSTVNFNRTLYIIWPGGNDLVFNSTVTVQSIVNSLMNGIRDLLVFGAKNLLIFNQAPIQAFPYFSRLNRTAYFSALTVETNGILQASLDAMQKNYTNTSIQMFDLNALLSKVIANQTIPFSNTVSRCWETRNLTTVAMLCSDPSTYVFIDNLHMTSTVHQLIADAVNPFLSSNGYSKQNISLCVLIFSLWIVIFQT